MKNILMEKDLIKNVEIKTNFYTDEKTFINDCLIISEDGLSYENSRGDSWEYLYKTPIYDEKYSNFIDKLFCNFVHDTFSFDFPLNRNLLRITINFMDDTWCCMTKETPLSQDRNLLTEVISEIIPQDEFYSPLIAEMNFKQKELNQKNWQLVKKEDIVAFMMADTGAMGSPGEFNVVLSDNTILHSNVLNKKIDFDFNEIFSLMQVQEQIESLASIERIMMNGEEWIYYYLGFGNRLYIKRDSTLHDKLSEKLFELSQSKRYRAWKDFVDNNILYDNYIKGADLLSIYLEGVRKDKQYYVTSRCWQLNAHFTCIYLKKDIDHKKNPLVFSIIEPDNSDKFYLTISIRPQFADKNGEDGVEKIVKELICEKYVPVIKTGISEFDNAKCSHAKKIMEKSFVLEELSNDDLIEDMESKSKLSYFLEKLHGYSKKL